MSNDPNRFGWSDEDIEIEDGEETPAIQPPCECEPGKPCDCKKSAETDEDEEA